eukprot:jgi/Tetstr1/432201/TSEL_021657.t1
MAAFQSGSLEMPEQGSILKLLEGLKNKSATKPADKKDAFIIRECNKIFKSRCLDRGYMHFTKKLALQAGIDCYPPDSEEADQSLKPHFPEQVLKELTATSHSRLLPSSKCKTWLLAARPAFKPPTPSSCLVEKDDTQHEGAVTRIKEWLALSKDEADALEDRKLGIFPRKASGDVEDGEEEKEAEEPLAQELCSLVHVGKSIAAGQDDGHATEDNEQAKANEDVANPVGEDDEEEEEEEGEEEGTGEDNTGSEEDEYDDEEEETEEEEEEEEGGHSSSEAADSECDDDVDDDASSDADDDGMGD